MNRQKPLFAAVLLLAVVGCDAAPTDGDRDALGAIDDVVVVDAASDDDAPPQRRDDDLAANVPLSPCGNGLVDDGEDCDDGWLNGNDRECTHACTINDCDLDEDGVCDAAHWPAADVDLYPCIVGSDDLEACGLSLGKN